ncbi:uncharacterized protein TNCT_10901, partial [Trichonephila clavata]
MSRQKGQMSIELRKLIIKHTEDGWSVREISEIVKRKHSTVHDIIKRYKTINQVENMPKKAHNKIFTEADERYLVRKVKSISSLQPESSGPESSLSHEEGSNSKDDRFFEEKQNELMARMLKRPILKPFVGLPPPKIKIKPASTELVWEKNTEPM